MTQCVWVAWRLGRAGTRYRRRKGGYVFGNACQHSLLTHTYEASQHPFHHNSPCSPPAASCSRPHPSCFAPLLPACPAQPDDDNCSTQRHTETYVLHTAGRGKARLQERKKKQRCQGEGFKCGRSQHVCQTLTSLSSPISMPTHTTPPPTNTPQPPSQPHTCACFA